MPMITLRSTDGFGRDGRGVAIVEFALIAPLLIVFYVGMCELVQGLMAERRANHAASAMADLVTQVTQVTKPELTNNVFGAGKVMIAPFPSEKLEMRVSSIYVDDKGVAKVMWTEKTDNWSGQPLVKGQTVSIPSVSGGAILSNKESAILAETRYTFTTPFSELFINFINPQQTQPGFKLSSQYYLRPRRSDQVECKDCT